MPINSKTEKLTWSLSTPINHRFHQASLGLSHLAFLEPSIPSAIDTSSVSARQALFIAMQKELTKPINQEKNKTNTADSHPASILSRVIFTESLYKEIEGFKHLQDKWMPCSY